jgi:hypothetical protein
MIDNWMLQQSNDYKRMITRYLANVVRSWKVSYRQTRHVSSLRNACYYEARRVEILRSISD